MIHASIGMPQGADWLVILAIVVLVFGAAKLPELARGTGQALRIFKSESEGLRDNEDMPANRPVTGVPADLPSTPTTQAEPTQQSDVETKIRPNKHPG